jgi:hypothetical protein
MYLSFEGKTINKNMNLAYIDGKKLLLIIDIEEGIKQLSLTIRNLQKVKTIQQ